MSRDRKGSGSYRINLRTLKRGATTALPDDANEAYTILLEYVVQGKHHPLNELLQNHYKRVANHIAVSAARDFSSANHSAGSASRDPYDDVTPQRFDINTIQNRHRRSLLHMAVGAGQLKTVKTLLEYGADPNLPDSMGFTSVHIAGRNSSTEVLLKLLLSGGKPDLTDMEGFLPLHWAACCGKLENVRILIKLTKNINVVNHRRRTALHLAVSNGHLDVLKLLLTFEEIDVDVLDMNSESALITSISQSYVACSNILISHGACLTILSKTNRSILELCLVKKMFVEAAEVMKVYDNFMKHLEQPLELGHVTYDVIKEFIEFIFSEHREEVWDLWTDLRNLVIVCAQELVDCSRTVESFPLFVRLLKHLRSLGVTTIEPISNKRPLIKRMITFPPKTPKQEEKLMVNRTIVIESQNISSYGEPSHVDCFDALDDVWKFLNKWMTLVKSYHSKTTTNRFMRRPYNLDANDLRDVAPQLCSLIKGYHIWSEDTLHYKQFLDFVSKFSKVLKLFLTFNTELIFGPLDFLLASPIAMVEFQNIRLVMFDVPLELRKSWFYDRLYKGTPPDNPDFLSEHLNLFQIDRDSLFSSSCEQVMGADSARLQSSLTINFHGDDGMGVGVRREWFTLLTDNITDPRYGLFQRLNNGLNFQPSCLSTFNPDHLRHFEFAGIIIAMLIYYKNTTGVHFTKSFYKHMLGEPLDFTDVACIDNDLAMSLQWLLDNDISDIMELTFSVDLHEFGEPRIVELKLGGASIQVTEENKVEYVRLISEYKMSVSIKPQITNFLKGFYSIVPRKILAIFSPDELELILCGLPIIDRKDWKSHVMYTDYTADHPMIVWFWEILAKFEQDELATLLKFITGYSRVPHGGFSEFAFIGSSGPIKIVRGNGTIANLPKSSVCFNMLMLPEYSSMEMLESRLRTAMSYASIGFDQC